MSDDEFELQLQQEAEEKERESKLKAGKLKVDPDGTVYDWDDEKKAWFPRVDEDFIARYQMSYGTDTEGQPSDSSATNIPPSSSDPHYAEWYHKFYSSYGGSVDTNSKEYREWYEYYYGNHAKSDEATETTQTPESDSEASESGDKKEPDNIKDNMTDAPPEQSGEPALQSGEPPEKRQRGEEGEGEASVQSACKDTGQQSYEDYYAYYYQQYGQYPDYSTGTEQGDQDQQPQQLDPSHPEYWNQYHSMELKEPEKGTAVDEGNKDSRSEGESRNGADKKGKKKKGAPQAAVPASWFEMDDSKNTTVYVAGLPPEITEEKFVTLMNKCGLIMYDPRTRKPKVKLYKDKDGHNKGDGRCCYIKQESVALALQFLDGSDVDGYKINVEEAKFELKGEYDPSKKKKKLTNSEKKKFKEKQEKLFDWRPDKPRGARSKHERVVIIKNFFDPKDFDTNPALINELRQDLREECQKFGEVKKVTIYDRHSDGVASVSFKEPEEADVCVEALDRRYFAGKRLLAETWDGKSKYEVEETEEQRQERLKKWEKYLEEDQAGKSKAQGKAQTGATCSGNTSSVRLDQANPSMEEGAVQGIDTNKEEESGASS